MEEPTFTLGLADLKKLSTAVCELDAFKPPRDLRMDELVTDCHDILIRTLGAQAELIYGIGDEPQQAAA